jgi:hypothetical protein
MAVKTQNELDEIRSLIMKRSREVNLTLADLSRAIGKNMSYVHQFIHRGSPARLPEEVRGALAARLQLPEAMLRPNGVRAPETLPLPTVVPPPYPRHPPSAPEPVREGQVRHVPVYSEEIDLSLVQEWAAPPPRLMNSDKLFAVWIRIDRGRCRSGDLVYFQTTQPPRAGDTVIVLKGKKIVEIGDLLSISENSATISVRAGDKCDFPVPEHRVMRAAFILCA